MLIGRDAGQRIERQAGHFGIIASALHLIIGIVQSHFGHEQVVAIGIFRLHPLADDFHQPTHRLAVTVGHADQFALGHMVPITDIGFVAKVIRHTSDFLTGHLVLGLRLVIARPKRTARIKRLRQADRSAVFRMASLEGVNVIRARQSNVLTQRMARIVEVGSARKLGEEVGPCRLSCFPARACRIFGSTQVGAIGLYLCAIGVEQRVVLCPSRRGRQECRDRHNEI